jgi:curved DNA-binding protein CbpA
MTMTTGIDPSRSGEAPVAPEHDLSSTDPYKVLGVNHKATPAEIKRAYFTLVRQYPPEEDAESFKLLRAAYEKLRHADVKAETDLFLFQPPEPWEPRKRKRNFDLEVHPEDVLLILHQHGDLGRSDFSNDFRKPDA